MIKVDKKEVTSHDLAIKGWMYFIMAIHFFE